MESVTIGSARGTLSKKTASGGLFVSLVQNLRGDFVFVLTGIKAVVVALLLQ